MPDETELRTFALTVCDLCLDGAGGECHVPGCAFWMHDAPDSNVRDVFKFARSLAEDADA